MKRILLVALLALALPALAWAGISVTPPAGAGTGDIEGVTAGSGLTDGGTSGTVTVNVGPGLMLDVAADTVDFDYTEAEDATWGDGSVTGGSLIWTFDIDGGTDPVLTFSDGVMALTGALSTTGGITTGTAGTGVRISSDGDGAITFLGQGDGYDEDLTINLDDTENTAVVSSSTGVTKISTGAIGFASTGIVSGKVGVITKAADYTLGTDSADEAYGYLVTMTATGTVTLPAVAIGMSVCVYSTTAAAVHVDPNANDQITLDGVQDATPGDSISSASGAGDFICLVGNNADGWITMGRSGVWTAN